MDPWRTMVKGQAARVPQTTDVQTSSYGSSGRIRRVPNSYGSIGRVNPQEPSFGAAGRSDPRPPLPSGARSGFGYAGPDGISAEYGYPSNGAPDYVGQGMVKVPPNPVAVADELFRNARSPGYGGDASIAYEDALARQLVKMLDGPGMTSDQANQIGAMVKNSGASYSPALVDLRRRLGIAP